MKVFDFFKTYCLSLVVLLCIVYLSLMKQPSTDGLELFEGADKVVHGLMYFGLSSMIWIEHLRKNRGVPIFGQIVCGAVVFPILWGGLMEIAQDYFTDDRACELLDFLANSTGVVLASLFFMFVHKTIRRWFDRH